MAHTHSYWVAHLDRESPPPGGGVPCHDTEHVRRPGLKFPPTSQSGSHPHLVDDTATPDPRCGVPQRFARSWHRFPWSALVAIAGVGAVELATFSVDVDPTFSSLVVGAAGFCGLVLVAAQAMSGVDR